MLFWHTEDEQNNYYHFILTLERTSRPPLHTRDHWWRKLSTSNNWNIINIYRTRQARSVNNLICCSKIILLFKKEVRGCTIPLFASLSSDPRIFLFANSDAKGTAPSVMLLLGTVPTELRGTLTGGWLGMVPRPIPRVSAAVSVRAGDDLRTGKFTASSSLATFGRFRGEEGIAPSRTPRMEPEPGTEADAVGDEERWVEGFAKAVWLAGRLDGFEELSMLVLEGGVLGTVSELLSWEFVSSCSWMGTLSWGDVTVACQINSVKINKT